MKHNVGSYDAAVRTVAGLLVVLIGHHYHSWWGLVGVVPVLTAMFACCPAYWPFGFDTTGQDAASPSVGDRSNVKNV